MHTISSGSEAVRAAVAGAACDTLAVTVTVGIVAGADGAVAAGAVRSWTGSAVARAGTIRLAAETRTNVKLRIAATPAGNDAPAGCSSPGDQARTRTSHPHHWVEKMRSGDRVAKVALFNLSCRPPPTKPQHSRIR